MSLIEEALRRVQDPSTKVRTKAKTPPLPPAVTPDTAPPQPKVHSWQAEPVPAVPGITAPHTSNALMIVAIAILALTTVLAIVGGMWMWGGGNRAAAPGLVASSPVAPIIINTAASTPTPRPAARPIIAIPEPEPQPGPIERLFRPRPVPPRQAKFSLSGLVEGGTLAYAVIDGKIVSVGDPVGDATVMRIRDGEVLLERQDGSRLSLRLPR